MRAFTIATKSFGPGLNHNPSAPQFRICQTCEFYREHESTGLKNKGLGTCMLFGLVDLVTGEKEFERAAVARSIVRMCGPDGRHYAPRAHWEHRHEKDVTE